VAGSPPDNTGFTKIARYPPSCGRRLRLRAGCPNGWSATPSRLAVGRGAHRLACRRRGRTQGGSDNAWCQHNEISWQDWDAVDGGLLAFTQRPISLRQEQPVFRRRDFLTGRERQDSGHPDVVWVPRRPRHDR
jgi:pullulanase/glycogen debranching enzyme